MIEVFHPGPFLKEEMIKRNKTISDLVNVFHLDIFRISQLFQGNMAINVIMAVKLEQNDWGSAEYWMGMQVAYDIQEARKLLNKIADGE